MYWNHRILERTDQFESTSLFIVEVYYNEDGTILGWTEQESVWCDKEEGVESLRQTLTWMLEALDKPVLNENELLAQAEEDRANGTGPFANEEIYGTYENIDDLLEALEDDGSEHFELDEEFRPYFDEGGIV